MKKQTNNKVNMTSALIPFQHCVKKHNADNYTYQTAKQRKSSKFAEAKWGLSAPYFQAELTCSYKQRPIAR
mgnify:CR=1 FL=1